MPPFSAEQNDPEIEATCDNVYTKVVDGEVHDFLEKVDEKEMKANSGELSPVKLIWWFFLLTVYYHVAAAYGIYLAFTSAKWQTIVYTLLLEAYVMTSVTAGYHRLWAHRTYKATFPLRLFLALGCTLSIQHSIYEWVQDHRVHHKYSDTNSDPYNAKRGFWYSHMFWIVTYKTEDCKKKREEINMSDIESDSIVMFQKKYYLLLCLVFAFLVPAWVPMILWGETFINGMFVASNLRIIITAHKTFLVNSAAHMWGYKPYDVNINPVENMTVAFLSHGEGFHNYHHTFPWDYAAGEFGSWLNFTTAFIDAMAWLGLCSNRKTVPSSIIEARKRRTGEGSLTHQQQKQAIDDHKKEN